jgi:hypothetical protein
MDSSTYFRRELWRACIKMINNLFLRGEAVALPVTSAFIHLIPIGLSGCQENMLLIMLS